MFVYIASAAVASADASSLLLQLLLIHNGRSIESLHFEVEVVVIGMANHHAFTLRSNRRSKTFMFNRSVHEPTIAIIVLNMSKFTEFK